MCLYIIIIKVFVKYKILSIETVVSACTCMREHKHTHTHTHTRTHTHTHTHTHTRTRTRTHTHTHKHSDYKKVTLHSLKWAANRDLMDKKSRMKQKTCQVYNFGKRNVFSLHLNESREGFCWRGRGSLFHVEGPKTEKAPTVESLVWGIWRLRVSEAERTVLPEGV